jgi:putative membrane protein
VPSDDGGHEPDYRFTLANERTFLAWIRTALGLLAGGIAVSEIPDRFATEGTRTALAIAAVTLSLVLATSSFVRWRQVQLAMRRDEPLPHPWAVPLLATGMAVVAGVVALVIAFR